MALAYSVLTSDGLPIADVRTITTAAFTPADNSLLLVMASALMPDGEGGNGTISDSTGLTWTNRFHEQATADWDSMSRGWTAQVGTGQSMTISMDLDPVSTDTGAGASYIVIQITGHNPADPIRQVFTHGGTTNSGSYSGNLTSPSLDGNMVFAVGCLDHAADDAFITEGTGWTNLASAAGGDFFISRYEVFQ